MSDFLSDSTEINLSDRYSLYPENRKMVLFIYVISDTFKKITELIALGEVRISNHGYDELAEDGLLVREIVAGAKYGKVVEDYPEYPKGPCVLVLQRDNEGGPVHAVWGIPKSASSPAVLVTAYKPDPLHWSEDFMERRK